MTTIPPVEKLDKTDWGDGLWQHEPDRVDFEHFGLPCLMLRNRHGVWCGYAAVLPGHPWHGREYSAHGSGDRTPEEIINVHGGLTFSGECSGSICHVPKPGQPDNVWWFGFDCNHCGDYAPGLEAMMRKLGTEPFPSDLLMFGPHLYRHQAWVIDEVKALAEQLAAVL